MLKLNERFDSIRPFQHPRAVAGGFCLTHACLLAKPAALRRLYARTLACMYPREPAVTQLSSFYRDAGKSPAWPIDVHGAEILRSVGGTVIKINDAYIERRAANFVR